MNPEEFRQNSSGLAIYNLRQVSAYYLGSADTSVGEALNF